MGPQEPLKCEEMEGLWSWERQVGWLHVAAMGCLVLASVAAYRFGDFSWLQRPLIAAVLVLVAVGAVLQFRARCPRCGARLRARILKTLPDKCSGCGVEFPRPPSER